MNIDPAQPLAAGSECPRSGSQTRLSIRITVGMFKMPGPDLLPGLQDLIANFSVQPPLQICFQPFIELFLVGCNSDLFKNCSKSTYARLIE